MPKRKTLAFGRNKPKETTGLVFTFALAAAVSACAHSPKMNPRQPTLSEDVQKVCKPKKQDEDCFWADAGEWAYLFGDGPYEKRCSYGNQVVLTGGTLLVGRYEGPSHPFTRMDLRPGFRERDISGILEPGLVDLVVSPDDIFILNRDSVLIKMPVGDIGEWLERYEVPFDVSDAKLSYHKKFVIVADNEHLAIATADSLHSATFSISLDAVRPYFFECNGDLFFGDEKENVEIRIKGRRLEDVQVI